jgi:endonuclease/exonuclease/phosphatase family metal-dependent hydrolase
MPARLSAMSGLPYHSFIKIRDFQGGAYGTAILSGYPILSAQTIPYPVTVAKQGTSCGYVTLDLGDGVTVTVFNTHLSVESEEANTDTLCCLSHVLRDWRATHTDGFVCCGDFNTGAEKILRYIPDVHTAHTGLLTYAHTTSIDHMLYTDPLALSHVRLLDTCTDRTTDHSMLLADVTVADAR